MTYAHGVSRTIDIVWRVEGGRWRASTETRGMVGQARYESVGATIDNAMNAQTCPRCNRALEACADDPRCLRCRECQGLLVPAEAIREEMLEGVKPAGDSETPALPAEPSTASAPCCPSCGQSMTPMQLAESNYYRCPACRGMWLDAGQELAQPGGGPLSLGRYALYTLSIPERALRSAAGLAGGVAKELAERLVPKAFQSSSTYDILVRNSLHFLVHNVGGVRAPPPQEDEGPTDDFLARKAVGNFVELAGMATMHFSPLLVLAVLSDLAYGSKAYLKELAEELRREGLIAEDSTIATIDQLLEAVGQASGRTARLFDTPPLSAEQLRASTSAIRDAVSSIDPRNALPQAEIQRLWEEMRALARQQNVGLFQLSSAATLHAMRRMVDVGRGTLSGLRLSAAMVNRHILSHYAEAMADLRQKGFYTTLSDVSGPYAAAVWDNFRAQKPSVTEDVLTGRMAKRGWRRLASWFRRPLEQAPSDG